MIIAHESVLRVLYGYLMACNATDIPGLIFPRNKIIEITPTSYQNEATQILIPNLPPEMIPSSPEDIKIPVPPSLPNSGAVTPMGLGTPRLAAGSSRASPREGGQSPQEPGDGSLLLVERAVRD